MELGKEYVSQAKAKSVMISPMPRTMSVQKTSSIKRVAHEPVKGAVHPMTSAQSAARPTTPAAAMFRESVTKNSPPAINTVKPTQLQRSTTQLQRTDENKTETSRELSLGYSLQYNDINPSQSLRNVTTGNVATLDPCPGVNQVVDGQLLDENVRQGYKQSMDGVGLPFDSSRMASLREMVTQNNSERRMIARNQSGSSTCSGTAAGDQSQEVRSLREQLEVQSKVNADLKKLLVASIGDDLHYKVDALVRTKVQLANEIGDYTRKLVEDYEDLDKITIQADLWHAKYQASRLLAEQLSSERDHVGYVCSQSQMALQNLLDEKKELHEQLLHLNRSLQSLHATFASSRAAAQLMQSDGHYLELIRNSNKLMDDICFTLMGSRPNRRPIPTQRTPLTPAEQVAFQALSSTPKNFNVNIGSNSSTGFVTSHIHSFPRFHPGARYEGFTLSCCKHCKGKLQVV